MPGPDIVLIDRSREPASTLRLSQVTRALQTQVDRDFGMVWGCGARIGVAPAGTTPAGAWSISVVDGAATRLGIHLDEGGRPHAVVRPGMDWTLAVSHVLLEMIADPEGRRFMEGVDISPGAPVRRVRYLLEVCDPCEVFHYEIDGIAVSDFVTPDYYRADAAPGTAFDFLRRLRRPLEVPRGGYLSWQDTADERWHQRRPDGTFSISGVPYDPNGNPRADRDGALGGRAARHDVPAIRRAHAPGRSRGARSRRRMPRYDDGG
jgi:hypothetical protein